MHFALHITGAKMSNGNALAILDRYQEANTNLQREIIKLTQRIANTEDSLKQWRKLLIHIYKNYCSISLQCKMSDEEICFKEAKNK